ncbi:M23 family metallopeptidase [Pseudonocardia sp. T1-2H]|uniref:M23 family metallopeptidase n=1 Tax=Pseudonocardia sp. T1-2H TaxID=3128899 RepID=UPI003101963B
MAAVTVAGGTLAAAGQAAYAGTLPDIGVGTMLLGAAEFTTTDALAAEAPALPPIGAEAPSGAAAQIGAHPLPRVDGAAIAALATAPVAAAPVAESPNVANLVKAAGPHQQTAAATQKAAEAVKAVDAEQKATAQAAERLRTQQANTVAAAVPAAAEGGVQIVVGQVSSGFGIRGGVPHLGMDIAAPIGTPIDVPLAGTVISSGPASGFGLWVRVQHADGTITVYGHINRSLVSVGQQVQAGQQIAEVGNRGESTGPHLHIEVITPDGTKINPQPWLDEHGFRYT